MSDNSKPYAIIAFVKPKATTDKDGVTTKYQGRSYKGITFAASPDDAKKKSTALIMGAFKESEAKITREVITIKSCKLYNDFLIPPKAATNG